MTSDDASAPVVEGAVPGGILSAGAAPIAPLISAPPRAISTVLPQDPATAKSAHIAGEVTIQAEIDASGKVVGMRVISGPAQLQPAALEALLQWTYEPARRDGQPVSGQVLETFKFRRQ